MPESIPNAFASSDAASLIVEPWPLRGSLHVGTAVRDAFELWIRTFPPLALTMFALEIPYSIGTTLLWADTPAGALWSNAIGSWVQAGETAAVLALLAARLKGREWPVLGLVPLAAALRTFLAVWATRFIIALPVAFTAVFVVPAVVIYTRYALAEVAVVIEGHHPLAAMRRSWALSQASGAFWALLLCQTLAIGIAAGSIGLYTLASRMIPQALDWIPHINDSADQAVNLALWFPLDFAVAWVVLFPTVLQVVLYRGALAQVETRTANRDEGTY